MIATLALCTVGVYAALVGFALHDRRHHTA